MFIKKLHPMSHYYSSEPFHFRYSVVPPNSQPSTALARTIAARSCSRKWAGRPAPAWASINRALSTRSRRAMFARTRRQVSERRRHRGWRHALEKVSLVFYFFRFLTLYLTGEHYKKKIRQLTQDRWNDAGHGWDMSLMTATQVWSLYLLLNTRIAKLTVYRPSSC